MNILITGGTGFVGSAWIPQLLMANHRVLLLTRKQQSSGLNPNVIPVIWDGKKIPVNEPVDVVVNLAGAPLADHRWTTSYKEDIVQSRINATLACVEYLSQYKNSQTVFLSASAVGYYGTKQTHVLEETADPGNDFLANIAIQWERTAKQALVRTVLLRFGVILSKHGGVFPKILAPFKMYAGGQIGSGKQGFPWVHIQDALAIIEFCIQNKSISGAVNVVAPEIITNKLFSEQLAKAMNRPNAISVPEFMVELALGEASMLVTEGQFVSPKILQDHHFSFSFPTLESALKELLT